ncbi:MAG: argininosuccinate lyase [Phycisphaerales bacterium]
MADPLWQKANASAPGADVQAYLAGDDVALDDHLLPFDITATIAHVRGLARIGMLSESDCQTLCTALRKLEELHASGAFVLDSRFEDGHSAIEWFLSQELGELGRRVHLGRSRNDQVLAAQRLYMMHAIEKIETSARVTASVSLDLAEQHVDTIMPGYTHLQRAVPSTLALWAAGHAEGFLDSAQLLHDTAVWLSASPLGTAAGYGVNLPLDRQGVADELGFARLLVNPLAAQNSRGKFEHQALAACYAVMSDVRRMTWDLSLFASQEFGFVRFDDEVSTGSSIMPNKRNPDLAELMRAAPAVVAGAMAELQSLLGLPSGYHRDLQLTKEPVIRGLTMTQRTCALLPTLLGACTWQTEIMKSAVDASMLATDRAVELAAAGMPFRDAYQQVAEELAKDGLPAELSAEASIQLRISAGACANLMLDALRKRLRS